MQPSATKTYNQLNAGINSEQSELNLQDGFTVDESNYELLLDGSRRRRRGLSTEASGANITHASSTGGTNVSQTYKWRNAGGDKDSNFIVLKVGEELLFVPDSDGGSASVHSETVDLDALEINPAATNMGTRHLDFTQGRGVLFVSGEYIYPTAITYDPTGNTFSTTPIEVQIRDYEGIDDGVALDYQVPSGKAGAAVVADLETDIPDHYYNLLMRGWSADRIIDFENNITGTARYPAKQQYFFDAYKRVANESVAATVEKDGTLTFDADKLDAEIYSGSDAPTGSMILSIFDDTRGFKEVSLDADSTYTEITGGNLAATDGVSKWTVRVTDSSHTFSVNDEINWKFKPLMYYPGVPVGIPVVYGATSTVTAISAGAWFEFEITDYTDKFGWTDSLATFSNCSYWGFSAVARSSGTGPLTRGPKAIEFHAGRLFYAGVDDTTWSDYVFFSQVVRSSDNWKRCHTDADPTAPQFNAPVITDGGYMTIPNLGNVKKMMSVQDSLLIFSDQGVWEITGRGTFFDPNQYRVRKITSAECGSPAGVCEVEGNVVYTGPKGVYLIAPDQYTRQLEATNISDDRIRTLWNKITPTYEPYLQTFYDDANKRVYILQGGTANLRNDILTYSSINTGVGQFNVVWVYDIRLNAWYKYGFNCNTAANAIITAYSLTGQDTSDSLKKMKFVVQKSATTSSVNDFSHAANTGFQDFDGNTPDGFMDTAWDNPGGPNKYVQAPIVTVYSKNTNTGFTLSGNGWAEDNPSSTTMSGLWDWTDDAITGKITTGVEVYRKRRAFVPASANDEEGVPVVVTRNKMRGRGRAFQLRFTSSSDAAGKDSHILGYTVVYKGTRKQ